MIELFKLCVIISPLYFMVYQPICMCALQRDPVSPLTTFIWGSVFPGATLQTVFLQACSRSGVRAFVWHLSITSGHASILHYSLLTTLQAHVFPFTLSKGTHHPACHYPGPSTTMSPFCRLFTCLHTGKKMGFLTMNMMRCGQTWSIVGETILKNKPLTHPLS